MQDESVSIAITNVVISTVHNESNINHIALPVQL